MSSGPHKALAVGLIIPASIDPEGTIFPAEIEKAKSHNLTLELYTFGVSEPVETIVAGFTQHLQTTKYDVISIGFGVRGNKDLTPVFEKLVNACIEIQPSAKLAFALMPHSIVEACERVLL